MAKSKEPTPYLRKLAEDSLQGVPPNLGDLSSNDLQTLVHELQVHQIELELQNDELRRTQAELETAHKKYSNLYHFAPVGYFTLNQAGAIEEVNQAGASLLGVDRSHLIKRSFAEFVYPDDQDIYYKNLRRFFATPAAYTADVRLIKPDGSLIDGHLVCIVILDDEIQLPQCLIIATDITELKHREAEALILAAAHERERLARDLHDAVSQSLFAATLIAEALPRLWDRSPATAREQLILLHQLSRGALAEMRTLLLELRPAALQNTDIGPLLSQLTSAIQSRKHLVFTLEVQPDLIIPSAVKMVFYRIAQEALNNVVKYANARQVTVRLVRNGAHVELSIQDDGRGFDVQGVSSTGFGLKIMQERADGIGAALTIASELGQGTDIKVAWQDTTL